jgi:hypothetical protein
MLLAQTVLLIAEVAEVGVATMLAVLVVAVL